MSFGFLWLLAKVHFLLFLASCPTASVAQRWSSMPPHCAVSPLSAAAPEVPGPVADAMDCLIDARSNDLEMENITGARELARERGGSPLTDADRSSAHSQKSAGPAAQQTRSSGRARVSSKIFDNSPSARPPAARKVPKTRHAAKPSKNGFSVTRFGPSQTPAAQQVVISASPQPAGEPHRSTSITVRWPAHFTRQALKLVTEALGQTYASIVTKFQAGEFLSLGEDWDRIVIVMACAAHVHFDNSVRKTHRREAFLALLESAEANSSDLPCRGDDCTAHAAQDELRRRVRLVHSKLEANRVSEAAAAIDSTPPVPITPEIRAQLEDLHPRCNSDLDPDGSQAAACAPILIADASFLSNCLAALPQRRSAGVSGVRYEHIRGLALFRDEDGQQPALEAFLCLFQAMLSGRWLPDSLLDSRLIALRKKNGKIRPIAVGEVMLRIAARIALRSISGNFDKYFGVLQFGVGCKAGLDKVVHKVRKASYIVSVDARNAFNSVSRSAILDALKAHKCDCIVPWFLKVYGRSSDLVLTDGSIIKSESGVRQGDPLGPFFFSIAIQSILRSIDDAKRCNVAAYMDDIFLYGEDADSVVAEFERLKGLLKDIKLEVAQNKCHFYAAEGCAPQVHSSIAWEDGIEVLGSAVGSADFIRRFLAEKKVTEVERLQSLKALRECELPLSLQDCLLLARFSTSPLARLGHLSRTIEPSLIEECLGPLDDEFSKFLFDILKIQLGEVEGKVHGAVAMLPIRIGGLGLGSVRLSAKYRFNNCLKELEHEDYDDEMDEKVQYDPIIDMIRSTNFALSRLHDFKEEKFRLSGAILEALPSNERLVVSDAVMRVFLYFRLGIGFASAFPALDAKDKCPLCGMELSQGRGVLHPSLCRWRIVWGSVVARHDDIKWWFFNEMQRNHLYPVMEPRPERIESRKRHEDRERPDIVFRSSTDLLSLHAADVVISSLGAEGAARNKVRKYGAKFMAGFHPLAFDSLGRVASSTVSFLCNYLSMGDTNDGQTNLDKCRLSVCFWRAQAKVFASYLDLCLKALRPGVQRLHASLVEYDQLIDDCVEPDVADAVAAPVQGLVAVDASLVSAAVGGARPQGAE